MDGKERWFGSVRFFKNMILLFVVVAIAVPTGLAIHYHRQLRAAADSRLSDGPSGPDALPGGLEQDGFDPFFDPAIPDGTQPPDDGAGGEEPPEEPPEQLGADAPAYQELYPDFYAPQDYQATERRTNTIFLTFDDGPSDNTDEILRILAEEDVKATFFVIGQRSEANLQRMRDIVEAGHTIGMHSYSHNYSSVYASVESMLEEFYRIFTQIKETTGVAPTVFRFPGGSINGYNGGRYQEMIAEMIRRGFVPYDWNLSAEDAVGGKPTAEQLANNVLRSSGNIVRGVVLLHDTNSKTASVEALPLIIAAFRERGYEFAALTPQDRPLLYNYSY